MAQLSLRLGIIAQLMFRLGVIAQPTLSLGDIAQLSLKLLDIAQLIFFEAGGYYAGEIEGVAGISTFFADAMQFNNLRHSQ